MEKQEWLDKCAAQFVARGGMTAPEAVLSAEACLEFCDSDLTEDPVDAADEEMSNWGD